jgi:nitroreductase
MELLRGIQTRRSIRGYTSKLVSNSVLKKILGAAKNAPSYTNTQPWEMTVVTGKKREELIQKLYEVAQSKKRGSPHLPFPKAWPEPMRKRLLLHMTGRWEAAGVHRGDQEGKRMLFLRNFQFFHAPVVFMVYMDGRLGEWSIFDLGLFVQNLCLAAHAVGLGTCIQAVPMVYPEVIAKCLGIPSSRKIVIAISAGYEDKKAPINRYRSEKKGIEEWVNWLG